VENRGVRGGGEERSLKSLLEGKNLRKVGVKAKRFFLRVQFFAQKRGRRSGDKERKKEGKAHKRLGEGETELGTGRQVGCRQRNTDHA